MCTHLRFHMVCQYLYLSIFTICVSLHMYLCTMCLMIFPAANMAVCCMSLCPVSCLSWPLRDYSGAGTLDREGAHQLRPYHLNFHKDLGLRGYLDPDRSCNALIVPCVHVTDCCAMYLMSFSATASCRLL